MCKESHDFLPFVILGESGPKVPAFPGMLTSSIQFDLTTIVCWFPPLSMHGPIWCFRKTRGSVRTTQVKVNSPTVSPLQAFWSCQVTQKVGDASHRTLWKSFQFL